MFLLTNPLDALPQNPEKVPELPEVETTVKGLKRKVLGREIRDIWTDTEKLIKRPRRFNDLKKALIGKKIQDIKRRGKNILFVLSEGKTLLIHQKLTGHLLYGTWEIKKGGWRSKTSGPLEEKINTYIHLLFTLDRGGMVALSDLRKFAKIELLDEKELAKELGSLGPEPLERSFTFDKLKKILSKRQGKIKQVLMDQKVIAGIGNIYSDEILWEAKVNPFKPTKYLSDKEIKGIYQAIKKVLKKAIKLRGTSTSDYRDIKGEKGFFQEQRRVYQREGEKCSRCKSKIKRKKIGGRSAHFCPKCQK